MAAAGMIDVASAFCLARLAGHSRAEVACHGIALVRVLTGAYVSCRVSHQHLLNQPPMYRTYSACCCAMQPPQRLHDTTDFDLQPVGSSTQLKVDEHGITWPLNETPDAFLIDERGFRLTAFEFAPEN